MKDIDLEKSKSGPTSLTSKSGFWERSKSSSSSDRLLFNLSSVASRPVEPDFLFDMITGGFFTVAMSLTSKPRRCQTKNSDICVEQSKHRLSFLINCALWASVWESQPPCEAAVGEFMSSLRMPWVSGARNHDTVNGYCNNYVTSQMHLDEIRPLWHCAEEGDICMFQ